MAAVLSTEDIERLVQLRLAAIAREDIAAAARLTTEIYDADVVLTDLPKGTRWKRITMELPRSSWGVVEWVSSSSRYVDRWKAKCTASDGTTYQKKAEQINAETWKWPPFWYPEDQALPLVPIRCQCGSESFRVSFNVHGVYAACVGCGESETVFYGS